MSNLFTGEIIVDVSIEKAWAILTDVQKWNEWKPGCPWIINNFQVDKVVSGQRVAYKRFTPSASDKEFYFEISDWNPPEMVVFNWGNGQDFFSFHSVSKNSTKIKLKSTRTPLKFTLVERLKGLAYTPDYKMELKKVLTKLKRRCEH